MNRDMLKEDRIHGNPMYPVSVYPDVEQLNGQSILDCHWHDEMEFILVTRGSAVFQIDMDYIEVHAGEALFVNSGEIHAGYLKDDPACIFSAVVFSPGFLSSHTFDSMQEKYLDPLFKKKLLPPMHITGKQPWEQLVLNGLHTIIAVNEQESPAFELITKAQLYAIFAAMYPFMQPAAKNNTRASASHDKVKRLKKALEYIHEHYSEAIKLRDLAAEVNMSEGHFCRFFKHLVQKSPVEYMNHYRILKASKLLENSDMKIVDVALEVGFDHLSYFITIFKKVNGITPSQYRKQFEEEVVTEVLHA
ncbi:AraC family transcriptional regulator [Paenibacillus sp. JX-17]|uniref:AraC family transcriptional regulator n=1 Tax=Paenibacillus lacisoli TaxID=3064525 RepID=A0ABT9CBA0_9BACL|nr:AraC family transcriptional regulator [Paenibacillus sp. JX-17]MDO7905934.1 AraC family transcriptional regulator [Paenibacillus sp. JX-17]